MSFRAQLLARGTFLLLLTSGLAGCNSPRRTTSAYISGKEGPGVAAPRSQSEYDFYCGIRPPSASETSIAASRPFAPTVYDAMKARGYKVYLVRYWFERPSDGFGGYGGSIGGYGFRDFFGTSGSSKTPPSSRTSTGQRDAVVWETRQGEFFLVDRYYASPLWLDGSDWLEKMRFYDPAAIKAELAGS